MLVQPTNSCLWAEVPYFQGRLPSDRPIAHEQVFLYVLEDGWVDTVDTFLAVTEAICISFIVVSYCYDFYVNKMINYLHTWVWFIVSDALLVIED